MPVIRERITCYVEPYFVSERLLEDVRYKVRK
jgi:hypothetical protein